MRYGCILQASESGRNWCSSSAWSLAPGLSSSNTASFPHFRPQTVWKYSYTSILLFGLPQKCQQGQSISKFPVLLSPLPITPDLSLPIHLIRCYICLYVKVMLATCLIQWGLMELQPLEEWKITWHQCSDRSCFPFYPLFVSGLSNAYYQTVHPLSTPLCPHSSHHKFEKTRNWTCDLTPTSNRPSQKMRCLTQHHVWTLRIA